MRQRVREGWLDRHWSRIWYRYFRLKQRLGVPAEPEDVQWLATERCNLSCKMCGSNAGRRAPDELTTAEIMAVIDDLAALGTRYLTLTGGEPLLREDLFAVLDHAAARGLEYNLVTNSTYVPRFAAELKRRPPAAVKVSIDGPPAVHADIRGDGNNFRACLEALSFFRALGVDTRVICTTLNQQNFPALEDLLPQVMASDATAWEFHLAVHEGRVLGNAAWNTLGPDQVGELFAFIIRHRHLCRVFMGEGCGYCGPYTRALYDGRRFFCGSGWTTFTIMPNGDVAGCPAFKREWTEGNVRREPVAAIWAHKFQRFRRLAADLPAECRECPHLAACHGGCWMQRRTGHHCFREVWEKGLAVEPPRAAAMAGA